ncbi:MAG: hypothetical protein P1T08_11525 [Acidimicrobiia bacterium]|nr:hypothetical protein [Acidimicrobiia bacterium]
MSRRRDLSGFGAKSQPAPQPAQAPEAHPPAAGETPSPRSPRAPKKRTRLPAPSTRKSQTRRITLSLPTTLASELKAVTRRDATYYIDIILNALVDHAGPLRDQRTAARRLGTLKVVAPRRRRPPGRTQVPLNIGEEALAQIDQAARELGMNRSAYVAELLERAL